MENSDSTNLYDGNLDALAKSRGYIRLGDSIEDPVNYLQNDAINNPIDNVRIHYFMQQYNKYFYILIFERKRK